MLVQSVASKAIGGQNSLILVFILKQILAEPFLVSINFHSHSESAKTLADLFGLEPTAFKVVPTKVV